MFGSGFQGALFPVRFKAWCQCPFTIIFDPELFDEFLSGHEINLKNRFC